LGGVAMGFIDENLGRAKGLKVFCFFSSFMGVDNSIRLKGLQVASGALKKRDKGLRFFFRFQKGFFFWLRRAGWGNSTPFQRRFFFKGLG